MTTVTDEQKLIEFALKENDRISRMRSSFITAKRGYFVNPGWEAPPERVEPPLPAAEIGSLDSDYFTAPTPATPARAACDCGQSGHGNAHEPGCPLSSYTGPTKSPRQVAQADDWQLVPKSLRDEIDNLIKVWQDAPSGVSFGRYMENALSKLCAERDKLALAASPSPPTQSVEGGRQVVRALRSSADIVNEALHTALRHIEHMAIWIGKLNSGYSFESLGEDMPIIRDALADRTRELAVTTQVLGEAQTRLSQFADAYDKLKKESADRIATLTKELDEARAAPATPPAQSVEGHAPTLLTYQERLIWLLGDLMNGVENFYRAANPKRLGHINCAAARIIDEVIDPSVATLAVALTEANQKIATLTKELAEAKDAIEPFAALGKCGWLNWPSDFVICSHADLPKDAQVRIGHLRAARDWLERNKATGEAG